MAESVPPAFLRWGCRAILSWRPTPVTAQVFHLHGSADRLIPLSRVRPTTVIHGAGHLPTLSHPDETNAFLLQALQQLERVRL